MTTNSMSASTPTASVVRSAGLLVLFWIVAFALVQLTQRVFAVGQFGELAQLLAAIGVLFIARRMDAKPAIYVLIVVTAFSGAELLAHLVYGIDDVQGGPTHIAVFASAAIALLLGALLTRRSSTS